MDATKKVTRNLGGDRLGSGSKNNISMHAYNRSTHDLSRAWRSSMNVGTLVPFFVEPALPGDTWSLDMEALVRTMPAVGPLYGSYKLQLDVFECPIRLYNGLLHNNMTKIGMNMAQVKLPKIYIQHRVKNPQKYAYEINQSQVAADSLINYLGISGIGDAMFKTQHPEDYIDVERKFNAVPILAYYDIYKNYYANKQEEVGCYIKPIPEQVNSEIIEVYVITNTMLDHSELPLNIKTSEESTLPTGVTISGDTYQDCPDYLQHDKTYRMELPKQFAIDDLECVFLDTTNNTYSVVAFRDVFPYYELENNERILRMGAPALTYTTPTLELQGFGYTKINVYETAVTLERFDLQNIDNARIEILKATGLNNELTLNNLQQEPYETLCKQDTNMQTLNMYSQCGLAIKTYQSDLFNNWLETEWINGIGGINQITAIDVSSGSFTIDALNLANKVYNMLNRVAVSGGSYEDYIEAVYTVDTMRRAESPVYKGGMSTEIVFEEVISTAAQDDQPLGSLAGKGSVTNKRGGHVEIRVDEPSFIMGIVSITPRLDYSQGNKWFMTELDTLDDLHKPALDGIGFEDLLQERMAWWGTVWDETDKKWVKIAAGKVPAWINYMTSVNETHGDFAEENKTMFMTLNRRYEYAGRPQGGIPATTGIRDMTTYINPTKFNYTFADVTLDAQNFWTQIGIRAEARRVMSAKIIPSL